MAFDPQAAKSLLENHSFKDLFIEQLGWDNLDIKVPVQIGKDCFDLETIAQKKGFTALLHPVIPDSPTRSKITNKVSKSFREHLIIYADKESKRQKWQWVRRTPGQPLARREHDYNQNQPMLLINKIGYMEVPIEEEDKIDIIDIYEKVRSAMDVDKITNKFYDRFKKEQKAFENFIDGIPVSNDRRWYSSVMLNRLMFIYFIQKKGFLDQDKDYLRNRLVAVQESKGKDKFQTFYQYFLMKLCNEALGKSPDARKLDKDLIKLLGDVPYLNGGIFQPHKLEIEYTDIDIPDTAFEAIFGFFDQFEWCLDSRPNAAQNEINPDVLGYIFEKYVNQKQMGAYYTKEDITEYISKNTIIPFLFDKAREKCKIAFEATGSDSKTRQSSVWHLLKEDPDRYIYPTVSHGIAWDAHQTPPEKIDKTFPLPPEIEEGIDPDKPDLFERRKHWNKLASPDIGLPTETWRDTVTRRQRYEEIRVKLAEGEICSINDLITYNLDIRQFAQDVIENCEGPELLVAFWKAIESITILDPACGSGAFLFAALNILELLYEACLERMRFFIEEWGGKGKKNHPNYWKLFTGILKRINEHPSFKYFVYKSIVINNLYGVDIMEEATEICKLRLFLKLVAQTENTEALEPLPDIDFNIRAGNSLIGFAGLEEVKDALPDGTYLGGEEIARIEEQAETVDRAFRRFHEMQTEQDMKQSDFSEAKNKLGQRLESLNTELDMFLASLYNINVDKKKPYKKWKKSHQPFHWLSEFYGIVSKGGFDVIIGNPPYVEYSKVKKEYTIQAYKTESCGNLYAFMMEKSFNILDDSGRFGMIVPVAVTSTGRMEDTRLLLSKGSNWILSFADRPSCAFMGVHQCVSIIIHDPVQPDCLYTSRFIHWNSEERNSLFDKLQLFNSRWIEDNTIPLKVDCPDMINIFNKILTGIGIEEIESKTGIPLYICAGTGGYWLRTFLNPQRSKKYREKLFPNHNVGLIIAGLLNSSVFYMLWRASSNCRDLMVPDIHRIKIPKEVQDARDLASVSKNQLKQLEQTLEYREGKMSYDQYRPAHTKQAIDAIDKAFAKYYKFADEELDFILNYDIKYRMGSELNEDRE